MLEPGEEALRVASEAAAHDPCLAAALQAGPQHHPPRPVSGGKLTAGDGTHAVSDAMAEVQVQGRHHVEVRNGHGALGTATVELSYHSLRVLPPIGKRKRYPELTLTVLHARERDEPVNLPDRPGDVPASPRVVSDGVAAFAAPANRLPPHPLRRGGFGRRAASFRDD